MQYIPIIPVNCTRRMFVELRRPLLLSSIPRRDQCICVQKKKNNTSIQIIISRYLFGKINKKKTTIHLKHIISRFLLKIRKKIHIHLYNIHNIILLLHRYILYNDVVSVNCTPSFDNYFFKFRANSCSVRKQKYDYITAFVTIRFFFILAAVYHITIPTCGEREYEALKIPSIVAIFVCSLRETIDKVYIDYNQWWYTFFFLIKQLNFRFIIR